VRTTLPSSCFPYMTLFRSFLPNLQTGPAYVRHDGLLQNSSGLVFPVSKWNFFEGGGAVLSVETSEALFAPLVARRLVEAQTAFRSEERRVGRAGERCRVA